MARLLWFAVPLLALVAGNPPAANASPPDRAAADARPTDPDAPTKKISAYCETNDTDCALFIDSTLIQGFWGLPENGAACRSPPPDFQTEDGRNLILPWIRAHAFPSDKLIVSLAHATRALTNALCTPKNSN